MAADLHVTEGMAGQGIAISGAFAVLTNLFISPLAGSYQSQRLLLGLTVAMGVSGAVVAMAPNYATYLLGRALIRCGRRRFLVHVWRQPPSRLVPTPDVPRALAIVNGGNALATVVATAGSLSGYGRRLAWCLFSLWSRYLLIALAWQWKALPSHAPLLTRTPMAQVFQVFTLFQRRSVHSGVMASSLLFMGQFSLFTYVRPFLETVTGVRSTTIPTCL